MAQTWWQKQGYSSDPTISSPLKGPYINFTPASNSGGMSYAPKAQTKTPAKPTGDVLGDSTSSAPQPKAVVDTSDTDSEYNKQRKQMEEEKKKREAQARKIGDAWDPIFEELNRQLANLPQREQEYKGQIEAGAEEGKKAIESSKQKSTEVLEKQKGTSLRNLEDDIRSQQESAGRKIGTLGAGSSSAVDQASEAVMRIGQRTRGDLLQAHETNLAQIESVANENLAELNTWKREKLFSITDTFRNEMNRLLSERADASSSRKRAVESLIFDLEKEYSSNLRQLDQQVLGYKQQVEAWKMQQAADVEARNQEMNSNATNTKLYQQALSTFNELVESGNVSRGQAQEEVLKAFGILLPVDDQKRNEFVNNTNYNVVTDVTGNPYYVNMDNINSAPQPVFAEQETDGQDFGSRFLDGLRGLLD